jgi:CRISPR system Cascade subunit CasB
MSIGDINYSVLNWWRDLHGYAADADNDSMKADSGRTAERAELRRCNTPEQVMLCKGFYRLRYMLEDFQYNIGTIATIAGICSHIRKNEPLSFPELLATPIEEGKTTPPLSESRFKKLISSRSAEEFFIQLRRAVHILNYKGNIPSIIDGVNRWYMNLIKSSINSQDTIIFKWSEIYYKKLLKIENSTSK